MDYQPIRPSSTSRILSSNTKSESLYWRKFKYPVFFKHDGPITSIHYVPFNQIPISANGQLESESDQQSQSQSILTPSSKINMQSLLLQKFKFTIQGIIESRKPLVDSRISSVVLVFDGMENWLLLEIIKVWFRWVEWSEVGREKRKGRTTYKVVEGWERGAEGHISRSGKQWKTTDRSGFK